MKRLIKLVLKSRGLRLANSYKFASSSIPAICDMQCKVQEKQAIGYNVDTKALCGHSS